MTVLSPEGYYRKKKVKIFLANKILDIKLFLRERQRRQNNLLLGLLGFPVTSNCKELACNARDLGLIPGSRRSPKGGHGNPLQYSCRENFRTVESGRLQPMELLRVRHN